MSGQPGSPAPILTAAQAEPLPELSQIDVSWLHTQLQQSRIHRRSPISLD
jgi:hypothetical protein